MIIVEGVDNSGKSTLVDELQERLKIGTISEDKPTGTPEQCWEEALRQLEHRVAIRDRVAVISELVYGPIIRGKSALGEYHGDALMNLYSKDVLIIYCKPPLNVVLDNQGREQMDGVIQNHRALYDRYDRIMTEIKRFGSCQVIEYDWTSSTSKAKMLDKVDQYFEKMRERALSATFWRNN